MNDRPSLRRRFRSGAFAALSGLLLAASLQADPVTDGQIQAAIASFNDAEAALARRGVMRQSERVAAAKTALAGLDVAEMAPSQIARLHATPLFALAELEQPALDRLAQVPDGDDAQAAAARLLRFIIRAETGRLDASDDVGALVRSVLEHPGLDEAVRNGWAPNIFLALAPLSHEQASALTDPLFRLERLLTDDLPMESRPDLYVYFMTLRPLVVANPSRAGDLERIRRRMVELLAVAQEKLPLRQRWYATRAKRALESDWATKVVFPKPDGAGG